MRSIRDLKSQATRLTLLGLFMIVGVNWSELEPSYRVGVCYGLAAAVFYAAYILSVRRLQAEQMGAPPLFCAGDGLAQHRCFFRSRSGS